MKNIINFKNLPTDIQLDVIRTLYFYDGCHIEHSHGKMSVQTSYCLKSHYADDEWISQEFSKQDLNISFSGSNAWVKAWTTLERKYNKQWADIEREVKDKCRADFNKMIEAKANEDLERIIKEAR